MKNLLRHSPWLTLFGVALFFTSLASAQSAPSDVNGPTLLGQGGNALPVNSALPTIWIIGDSTVRNGQGSNPGNGQWGWGAPIEYYFDRSKINVVNRAVGGTSSRSYYSGNWPAVLKNIKKGDYLFIQFGHNDNNGVFTDAGGYRASLNGIGDETQEVTNRSGQPETVHTFGWYLSQYVEQAKAQGATPIICSLIPRKIWEDGKIVRANAGYFAYADWAGDVAKKENVAFIDLNAITARKYNALGADKVEPLFVPTPSEHTHTNWYGAVINAESVIGGLKLLANNPFAPYLSDKGQAIPAADPAKSPLDGTSTVTATAAAAALYTPAPAAGATAPPPASAATAATTKPTLFIVGDSTASNGADLGWGSHMASFFDLAKINVLNRAHGGASARSFVNAYWSAMMDEIKPGDYILVQFGHNDGGTPGQGTRPERPDLRGLGDDTVDITDAQGKPETVHSFGWYIRKYIADGQSKGATVIIVTPTPTNNWANGKIGRGLGQYGQWLLQVAAAQHVASIDFNSIVADKYDAMGQDKVAAYYNADRTHSQPEGAEFNAANVVSGLKALKGNPLGAYLSAKGQVVDAADVKYVDNNAPRAATK
jgi:lysophospholipase L1-like esterase